MALQCGGRTACGNLASDGMAQRDIGFRWLTGFDEQPQPETLGAPGIVSRGPGVCRTVVGGAARVATGH